jgi:hypothetical protein
MISINLTRLNAGGTFEVAAAVLEAIDAIVTPEQAGRMWVGSFANGREQGFCLSTDDADIYPSRKVSFSGHKVCDSISVYAGEWKQFHYNSNQPKEEHWDECARYFGHDETELAARFILDYLLQGKKEVQQI